MDYTELDIKVTPRQPGTDLLISELAENGFESFVETETGFLAYIPLKEFSEMAILPINTFDKEVGKIEFSKKIIPSQNWNAEWEKDYQPIVVSNKLLIRAPFHATDTKFEMELVIQPQQSFGTGHHPTTRLMAEKLLTMPLHQRYILDMGCGTGVLAILANKLGASSVIGIDIELNSVENAKENLLRNNVVDVTIEEGTENNIRDRKFDLILANINKNVLLKAMTTYSNAMNKNAQLLLSGFFLTDVEEIKIEATKNRLDFMTTETDGEWALLHFKKG
jgi:ribosomal protein L11 methyltransferase